MDGPAGTDGPDHGPNRLHPLTEHKRVLFLRPLTRRLLDGAWWGWSAGRNGRNVAAARGADIEALEAAS